MTSGVACDRRTSGAAIEMPMIAARSTSSMSRKLSSGSRKRYWVTRPVHCGGGERRLHYGPCLPHPARRRAHHCSPVSGSTRCWPGPRARASRSSAMRCSTCTSRRRGAHFARGARAGGAGARAPARAGRRGQRARRTSLRSARAPSSSCAVGRRRRGAELARMLGAIGVAARSCSSVDRATTTKTRVRRARPASRAGGRRGRRRLTAGRHRAAASRRARARDRRGRRADSRGLQQGRARRRRDRARDRGRARERGIPVVVDPKYRNFFSYRGRDDLQAEPARARSRARRGGGPRAPARRCPAARGRSSAWSHRCSRWASAAWR